MFNEELQQAIGKAMAETEAEERNIIFDAQNVTMDTFCQYPVTTSTQGDNVNTILTSKKLNNSDALAETLKGLTIKDAGYYNSEKNDAEGDPASDTKVATHNSDIWKTYFTDTDTSNRNLQQKSLINQTLLIITMTINPHILDRVVTCGGITHAHTTPITKEVLMDAARSSA